MYFLILLVFDIILSDDDNKCYKYIEECNYCINDETWEYCNTDGYVKDDDNKYYECMDGCYNLNCNKDETCSYFLLWLIL